METGKKRAQQNDNIDRLDVEGKMINNYKDIAETLNKHFISVAKNIVKENNQNDPNINRHKISPIHYLSQSFKCTYPDFKFKLLSMREISNIIMSLKSKNSSGYDSIPTNLLKISSPI